MKTRSKRQMPGGKCKVRRMFGSLFLAALLFIGSPSGALAADYNLIANPLSAEEYATSSIPSASSTLFQSLDAYSNSAFTYKGYSESDGYYVYSYTAEPDDLQILRDYANLLGDCMNMELLKTYEQSYSKKTYWSCALNYTGTGKVTGSNGMMFCDDVSGTVTMWATVSRTKLEMKLYAPITMGPTDMGWRCDGSNVAITLAGESVAAGLYRLSDGSYITTDGRLSATIGQADILMDGEQIISGAEYRINENKEVLEINDFYRTESVYFTTETNQLLSGDIFTYEDLAASGNKKFDSNNADPDGYRLGTDLAVYHNGNWRYPLLSGSYINDLTVRVMYYEQGVAAVFYIYLEMTTSPYTIEILAAVDLSSAWVEETTSVSASSYSFGSSDCIYCYGSGVCSGCNGKGYKTRWRGGEQTEIICASCVGTGECAYCR